ncbi:hypothetical protein L596_005948 [Steinernema carpocapsae]|uniref:Uncharacterized protein n=1 Tax=Steinernema carpocapsae TaxID=34508 RepID=A0A4V6I8N0_STECR|nr:hypothetical protein L596_005948 [Steinernema carpocapsae]
MAEIKQQPSVIRKPVSVPKSLSTLPHSSLTERVNAYQNNLCGPSLPYTVESYTPEAFVYHPALVMQKPVRLCFTQQQSDLSLSGSSNLFFPPPSVEPMSRQICPSSQHTVICPKISM